MKKKDITESDLIRELIERHNPKDYDPSWQITAADFGRHSNHCHKTAKMILDAEVEAGRMKKIEVRLNTGRTAWAYFDAQIILGDKT